jgi:hypothetical protein
MLKKILTILSLALAFVLPSMAQEVILKASVDRDKILIGEHIRMKLYVEIPTATPMGWSIWIPFRIFILSIRGRSIPSTMPPALFSNRI